MSRVGALLLAMLAAPALAQAPPVAKAPPIADNAPLTAADPEAIARYMQQIGFRAELSRDSTGDPRIETGLGGVQSNVWFYDCTDGKACQTVQFQAGLLTKTKLSAEAVNGFNRTKRFATLALDTDRDPILTYDLSMESPGIPAIVFGGSLRVFESQVAALRQLVTEAEGAKPEK